MINEHKKVFMFFHYGININLNKIHFIPFKLPKMWKNNFSQMLWPGVKLDSILAHLIKLKLRLFYDPTILLLSSYPRQ